MEFVDIVNRLNLRCGVAVKCHTGIHRRHTTTIVGNLDKLLATITKIDTHRMRSGIDRVLHHLLHDIRWRIDHLTGGNLIGDNLR